MTDITSDGIQLPSFDLSTKSPSQEDDGRLFYHNGNSSITLVSGSTTNRAGIYNWNYGKAAWGTFPDSEAEFSPYIPEDFLFSSSKAVAGGVASLDSNGELPDSQVPSVAISNTDVVANQTERLALAAETGDVAIQNDENQSYILKGTDPSLDSEWKILKSPTDAVDSVFGRTGAITTETGDYTHAQIGNVSTDDHHTRYSNQEARNAVSGASLSGGLSLGSDLNVSTSIFENTNRVATRTWTNANADVPNADYADSAGDADTLDGEHAGAFANASHGHSQLHNKYTDGEARGAIEAGGVNQVTFNNIEDVGSYQLGIDASEGFLGNWGNGTAVLWDSHNVSTDGNLYVSGGTGSASQPTIGMNNSINVNRVGGSGLFFDFNNSANWIELVDGGGVRSDLVTGDVYVDDLNGGTWLASDAVTGGYDIQKNGTDANGVINFKT